MNELFSPQENRILKILGKKKKTIIEITDELYKGKNSIPLTANNGVASAVRRINRKCEYHKTPWFLNGMGGGRAGKTVWRDKR